MEPTENIENVDGFYDYLPADHPLYRRMQAALEEQLKKEEESLRLLNKEKSEELRKVKRTREEIGINLYSYQQQYAQLEALYREKNDEYINLKEQREKIEKQLAEEVRQYNEAFVSVREQQKMELQAKEELNQLNSMLKYVEAYNQQMDSEIKVTSTTGHVVEKKIKENEQKKLRQDYFIDYLEEQIKNLTERQILFQAQLKAQQEETKEARKNLSEAQVEIENLLERKRNLLKDWDKSLISMKTRDKALQVVRDNIKEQEGEMLKLRAQIARHNDLIQNEIFTNNSLQHEIRKVVMKQRHVDNQIKELAIKKSKVDEKRAFLRTSSNKTKDELKSFEVKESTLNSEIDLIEKNRLKLLNEAKSLFDKNLIVLSSKETHEKQAENLLKLNAKLSQDIFETEIEIQAKENEIVRVEIDKINVDSQNNSLKEKLREMNDEINKFEKLYSKSEGEIRNNHKELEKRQLKMDKLNKDFGELTKNKGGEEEGLFEVKIKELNSELVALSKALHESEQEWINKKTQMVSKESSLNGVQEENIEKQSKKMILEHKRKRLNNNYEIHEKEIRDIEVSLKNLRYDMNKYNRQLGKNVELKEKFKHQFQDVDAEYKDKLKQMENESVRLEVEIEVLREEKADTLTQVLEVERQIHLWERKIQLEEKMQQIIKPEKGIKEIDEMKSAIHRQELDYVKLKAKQEKIIGSMEMLVQRREFIKLRYPKGNSVDPQKELTELKNHIKHIENKQKSLSSSLSTQKSRLSETNLVIHNFETQTRELQMKLINYQNEYFIQKLTANGLFCATKGNQDATKMLEEFRDNKFKPRKKEVCEKEMKKYVEETQMIMGILRNLGETHPEWSEIINKAVNI